MRRLHATLAVAILLAGHVHAADEDKAKPATDKKAAKQVGEPIPQKLALLVLGRPVPPEYLAVGGPETVQQVRRQATLEMWRALAPEMSDAVEGAYVGSYKGGVAWVRFGLRNGVKFQDVHRYFAARHGKGKKANVRVPKKPGAHEDCPAVYLIQEWSDGKNRIKLEFSAPSAGGYVTLSGPLAREEEEATKDDIPDHESCI
jgi:hypothetical protein